MLSVRHVLLWMLLGLMPLQGFAAASMLCCPVRSVHGVVMSSASSDGMGFAPVALDARAHKPDSTGDQEPLHPGGEQERHGRGLCASLCHAIALTGTAATVNVTLSMDQPSSQDPQPITKRPFPVADKPPRA